MFFDVFFFLWLDRGEALVVNPSCGFCQDNVGAQWQPWKGGLAFGLDCYT